MILMLALLGPVIIIGALIYMGMNITFRKAFLYLFATVGLVLCVIGLVSLINLGLRTYVFTKADFSCRETYIAKPDGETQEDRDLAEQQRLACEENRVADKQRTASNAIALLIVGAPLYLYNWRVIRRDKEI